MLACVCQPTETALLLKGGAPVAMGPLGTSSKARHNNTDAMKAIKLLPRTVRRFSDDTKDSSPSHTSSPSLIDSSEGLLNLRKIERKAKSTKILVNPVCSDSISNSDDSNRSKSANSKWNGKKKRLKSENGKYHKATDCKSDKNDAISRNEAREDKKSISCFKMKSSGDKSRLDDDRKSGRENCTNENSSNLIGVEKPDLINHSRKNSREILVDESTMTDEMPLKTDQLDPGKTDSAIAVRINEVC